MINEKRNKGSESFQRWQGRTIEQMGAVINTILALAVASIGFLISKILEEKQPSCLILAATINLILCVIVILILIWNRLSDFRLAAHIARNREKGFFDQISKMRKKNSCQGKMTWKLLKISIVLFIIGYLLVGIWISIYITNKG